MVDQLTATGLTIDDYATRLGIVTGELRTAISAILDFGEDQPTGQFVRIILEHQQQLAELLQELHSAIDPDEATGQSLDAVCSITGTYRNPETYGTVVQACTFTGVVVLPVGTQVSVAGDPDNIWELLTAFTSAGAGTENVTFTCAEAGSIEAPINTVTVIATPVAGWTATINSGGAATAGDDRETDTALRLRREIEVTIGGSTSVDSIAAEVSQLTGVEQVICYENDSWRAVAPMPPHSSEVVYWTLYTGAALTALNVLIAEAIFESNAGGPFAYGTTYVTHTDDQNNDHEIGMTLADDQRIMVDITVTANDDYIGDAALALVLENWAADNLGIADDVYRSVVSGVALDLDAAGVSTSGIDNVSQVLLSINPAAPAAADITIGAREIATLDDADVTVHS